MRRGREPRRGWAPAVHSAIPLALLAGLVATRVFVAPWLPGASTPSRRLRRPQVGLAAAPPGRNEAGEESVFDDVSEAEGRIDPNYVYPPGEQKFPDEMQSEGKPVMLKEKVQESLSFEVSDEEVNEFLAEIKGEPTFEKRGDMRLAVDAYAADRNNMDLFEELRSSPVRMELYERGMPDRQGMITLKDRLGMIADHADRGRWREARYMMRSIWRKSKLRLPLGRYLWNLMIKAHARAGRPKAAESWVENMLNRVYQPDIIAYNTLMGVFAKKGLVFKIKEWMRRMDARGVKPDCRTYAALASAYAKKDDLRGAERAVQAMMESGTHVYNAYPFNAVLKICANYGDLERAEKWMERIQDAGVRPDEVSYLHLIRTAGQVRDTEAAAKWLDEAQKAEIFLGNPHFHAAMSAHARCADLKGTQTWMRVMEDAGLPPDLYTFNILLSAHAQVGDVQSFPKILERMEELEIKADIVTFSTMIGAFAESGDGDRALKWLILAEEEGLNPDLSCYNQAIKAFAKAGNSTMAERIGRRLLRNKQNPDVYTYNILLSAFAKDGRPAAAEFWVDHMRRTGRWRQEDFPVRQMAIAYTEALLSYVRVGNLEAAEAWHAQMFAEGVEPEARAYTALIKGHLERGNHAEAQKWLTRMSSWSGYIPSEGLVELVANPPSDVSSGRVEEVPAAM